MQSDIPGYICLYIDSLLGASVSSGKRGQGLGLPGMCSKKYCIEARSEAPSDCMLLVEIAMSLKIWNWAARIPAPKNVAEQQCWPVVHQVRGDELGPVRRFGVCKQGLRLAWAGSLGIANMKVVLHCIA